MQPPKDKAHLFKKLERAGKIKKAATGLSVFSLCVTALTALSALFASNLDFFMQHIPSLNLTLEQAKLASDICTNSMWASAALTAGSILTSTIADVAISKKQKDLISMEEADFEPQNLEKN